MNNHKKIEKSWAVYGWFHGPWGIGKVTDEYSNTFEIKYCENQMYFPESWSSEWVQTFNLIPTLTALENITLPMIFQTKEKTLKDFFLH